MRPELFKACDPPTCRLMKYPIAPNCHARFVGEDGYLYDLLDSGEWARKHAEFHWRWVVVHEPNCGRTHEGLLDVSANAPNAL